MPNEALRPPTDSELGIDTLALQNDALTMGASSQIPQILAEVRAARLKTYYAELGQLAQIENLTGDVHQDKPPYFAR